MSSYSNHRGQRSKGAPRDSRLTPPSVYSLLLEGLGVHAFDLDPASNPFALWPVKRALFGPREVFRESLRNCGVKPRQLAAAERFVLERGDHVLEQPSSAPGPMRRGELVDGLAVRWRGHVGLNPPWRTVEPWAEKVLSECRYGSPVGGRFRSGLHSVSVVVPGNTDTKWWRLLAATCDAWAVLEGRQHFPMPGAPEGERGNPPTGAHVFAFVQDGRRLDRWCKHLAGSALVFHRGYSREVIPYAS